jgi:plasmid stabilization system protein ParE
MKIVRSRKFLNKFKNILAYIAKDKISASKKFREELNERLKELDHFPYKYRKSFYFNDENIRDLIFKGYTIIYKIEKDKIIILDIFKKEQYENL